MGNPYLDSIESEPLLDGRFSEIRRIDPDGGNGYFSLLFTAKDQDTGKTVALKFFDPARHDADRVARFEREGEFLERLLGEPSVIDCVGGGLRVFNKQFIDPASGHTIPFPFKYIVMELASGSVEDFIYNGTKQPTPISLLRCFKQLVKAVFRLHSHNICHRDLKPSNFLICGTEIKISDLGTAKCMLGTMPDISTAYITPVGDLRYIGPEHFLSLGIADDLVYRSDVFALGAILFEMFTSNILTDEIYSTELITELVRMRQIFDGMTPENKLLTFRGIADQISSKFQLPDIFLYNNNVPGCIKHHLNHLYKRLAQVNPEKRLYNNTSIHRILDICILTLENEANYQMWLEKRRTYRVNRQAKSIKKLETLSVSCQR